mmetsp:Transcript_74251/g.128787  ORF Transcript_74251/g.128787 Transcript_74251/m.128787 type:complete len:242 (-) Transcript_74251:370-1095(-)
MCDVRRICTGTVSLADSMALTWVPAAVSHTTQPWSGTASSGTWPGSAASHTQLESSAVLSSGMGSSSPPSKSSSYSSGSGSVAYTKSRVSGRMVKRFAFPRATLISCTAKPSFPRITCSSRSLCDPLVKMISSMRPWASVLPRGCSSTKIPTPSNGSQQQPVTTRSWTAAVSTTVRVQPGCTCTASARGTPSRQSAISLTGIAFSMASCKSSLTFEIVLSSATGRYVRSPLRPSTQNAGSR